MISASLISWRGETRESGFSALYSTDQHLSVAPHRVADVTHYLNRMGKFVVSNDHQNVIDAVDGQLRVVDVSEDRDDVFVPESVHHHFQASDHLWLDVYGEHSSCGSDSLGGAQGEKTTASADIRNDIALLDPEEIEEFLRLLAFDSFRPVKPSRDLWIDQLGLELNAGLAGLGRRTSRQQ